ncbi:lamin-like protein [Dioscorea cayenensis subsp. rotundata]|uniref:Lamin-like protein n=1 Tax=Dioscorea cayennensis subsp. rotundata TaxID=55577 RepID=A0AB40AIW3_DIOCR|nr:lamin-like protein [Dioscorea cayenensis subsp. rotundata]
METLRTHLRLSVGASPSILLIAMLFLCVSVSATKHDVGGKQGWAPNVNYTDWASHERFFVGEWLVFYYQKGMYDVVQVNSTAFDRCSAENAIMNWSRGHSFAFQLKDAGNYYFICSRGQCYNGMKLSILVHETPAPAPSLPLQSAPSPSGSSALTRFISLNFAAAAVFLAGVF